MISNVLNCKLSYPLLRLCKLCIRNHTITSVHNLYHGPTSTKYNLSVPFIRSISKKAHTFPELLESDLKEDFIKGSGPGGQSVATSSNCVQLTHIPTGVQVKVHETRSQQQNRKIARERLLEYVDLHINKDNSYLTQKEREEHQVKKQKRAKTRDKLELKKRLKEKLANLSDDEE